MVKIDTVVLPPDQKKKLLENKPINPTEQHKNDSESDNRYKVLYSNPDNGFDRCLFYMVRLILKRPVICSLLLILLLVSLVFIGPVICYVKCIVFLSSDYDPNSSTDLRICNFRKDPLFFKITVNTTKVEVYEHPPSPGQCKRVLDSERFDCLPRATNDSLMNQFECQRRGCCWSVPKDGASFVPNCFYPFGFKSYGFINDSASDTGAVAYYGLNINSTYPNNIPTIKMDFNYRTEDILEVKIYDPTKGRYETPFPELPPMGKSPARNTKYSVEIDKFKFGFRVLRKSNNRTIFDTQDVAGLIFADQVLQLSAKLPSKNVYGLGQQKNNFLLDFNFTTITLFNHDQPPVKGSNLYGSHPFYIAMEEGGESNGVLLLNSNAMDITLIPAPGITYRTIGGVLDFFFFLGPTPAEVVQQYTGLVGRPFLPPYWSLGFHLCRFGYKTLNETMTVWNRTRNAKIPFDTQWNDLDYMENGNDFTYSKTRFKELPEFVDLLHKEGMHYVVLVDPGVSAGETPGKYPPYDDGIAQSVFVTDYTGYRPLLGKVWNKEATVFVDFFKPVVVNYWLTQLRNLHNYVPFDGAWIDMNDPSNFVNGTLRGCGNTTWEYPPYVPAVAGGQLRYRTLCMSARHRGGTLRHYDVHNVYALAEAILTSFSMQQIRNKRPFVISRSSFPGLGRYAGVWTGDVDSTWEDMAQSISDVMSFSLFGIPMSGADICGFNKNATVALCQRWSQLGAFYTFSRNHNSDLSSDQDPVAMGPEVEHSARKALLVRYSLLPYLYTLLWHAHTRGDTVIRPLFMEFPNDNNTYSVKSEFMWGPGLLIIPALEEKGIYVIAYLPEGRWYDLYTSKELYMNYGTTISLPAPLDTIPLMLRGGFIIPTQRPDLTTTNSRLNPMDLLISLDESDQAKGDLYWDDGDTLDHNEGVYNYIKFTVQRKRLYSEVVQWRYTNTTLILGKVKFMGVTDTVKQVFVDKETVPFQYQYGLKLLEVVNLYLDMSKSIEITWK